MFYIKACPIMLIGEPTTSVEIYNEAKESGSSGIYTMPILKFSFIFPRLTLEFSFIMKTNKVKDTYFLHEQIVNLEFLWHSGHIVDNNAERSLEHEKAIKPVVY